MPDLIRKARQGDGHANDVLTMVAHAMGDTIQIVAQAYDPQRIIIGGGMAKTGDALIEVIQAELSRRAEGCRFLTTLDIASNIRIAAIDQPIGAIRAALAAKSIIDNRKANRWQARTPANGRSFPNRTA